MNSAQPQDLANLCLRKEKKQLLGSFDASFDLGTTLAPPNTQSKDKEGPSTAKRGRKGTGRKGKERSILARTVVVRKSKYTSEVL